MMKCLAGLMAAIQLLVMPQTAGMFLTNRTVYEAEGQLQLNCPSAVLMEASTGRIIYEKDKDQRRSPASITKIMTLLLAMEALADGRVSLEEPVIVSEYASSMGGSQVFLAEGEQQSFDTILKCVAVASGNDASVALAEHLCGSEEAFVARMNERAKELGMENTHFLDCCGLSNDDGHYTSAGDVAIMSRELITKHPQIFSYTQIWMEDITHVTRQGSSQFTLTSTNKLLKQYPYATGLKTGSTNKAKYCFCATANKDGMELIAVVMGAQTPKERFREAKELLSYGYANCRLYRDENHDILPDLKVKRGKTDEAELIYQSVFEYVEIGSSKQGKLVKEIYLPECVEAPLSKGETVGYARYLLNDTEVGRVPILLAQELEKAGYFFTLKQVIEIYLFEN